MRATSVKPFRDVRGTFWRHPSVYALMSHATLNETPEDVVRRRCRKLVSDLKAFGWEGPPYDPRLLASYNGIEVEVADTDLRADARIFPREDGRLLIQYSDLTSLERQQFSIFHEIAHTCFPDCYEEVRHRHTTKNFDPLHQELEKLCNLGAAEMLMPQEDFMACVAGKTVCFELANSTRGVFAASLEAVLYRLMDLTEQPCAVAFLSKRLKPSEQTQADQEDFLGSEYVPKFRVDYTKPSNQFSAYLPQHKSVPDGSVSYKATSDYFPAAMESWAIKGLVRCKVQAARLPCIPGTATERVAALLTL